MTKREIQTLVRDLQTYRALRRTRQDKQSIAWLNGAIAVVGKILRTR